MQTVVSASISQSIRQVYKKRLLLPVCYLLFLAMLWLAAPISELVLPHQVSSGVPFRELRTSHFTYISTTLTDLHFTGYTQKIFGYVNGYYYYTFQDGQCLLVLLSPASCKKGMPDIDHLHIRARIIQDFDEYDPLTLHLAEDLDWTASGIRSQIPDYLLSEPGFHKLLSFLLLAMYFVSGACALAHLLFCACCICFPALSPACRKLGRYGNAARLLAQAEAELAASPLPAAENVYITENYFIALTRFQTAVVPIHKILWIYKHTAAHKLFGHHFPITYTLHIRADKSLHIECPDIAESDIDRMISNLSKADPGILVGFHEKNRQQMRKNSRRL